MMGRERLIGEAPVAVRGLAGFRKGTRLPDAVTPQSEAFVARLGADDITADIDARRTALREAFHFKRKDLDSGSGDDGGWITTPFFDYHSRIGLDPRDPAQAVWHRELHPIRDTDKLLSDAGETAFRGLFDRVRIAFPEPVDLAAIVDAVEDANPPDITIDYDQAVTWCTLRLAGLNGTLHFTPRGLTYQSHTPTLRALYDDFARVRGVLFVVPASRHLLA